MLLLPAPFRLVVVLNSYLEDGTIIQNVATSLIPDKIHIIPKMLPTHRDLVGGKKVVQSWVLTMDSNKQMTNKPIDLSEYGL